MNDIDDRVRETVRKDNPNLPLKQMDSNAPWYMGDAIWPYFRELKEKEDERQTTPRFPL